MSSGQAAGNGHAARRARHKELVRAFYAAHIGATQKEAARALGLCSDTVRRHIADIRAEWRPLLAGACCSAARSRPPRADDALAAGAPEACRERQQGSAQR